MLLDVHCVLSRLLQVMGSIPIYPTKRLQNGVLVQVARTVERVQVRILSGITIQ